MGIALLSLTDRYDVESIDPLCDGWQFGLGYDTRLQRQVLIAMISNQVADQNWFNEWLQRRSAVSHSFVAELLDGERLKNSFLCIFSRTSHVQIGLPTLPDHHIYEAVGKIIQGTRMLYQEKIHFRFSAGQVLWDGENPRLLGLPMSTANKENLSEGNPTAISNYTASLLEWNASIQTDEKRSLSVHVNLGINRLKETMSPGNEGFNELTELLQALENRQNIIFSDTKTTLDDDNDENEEHDQDFESIEEESAVTAFPLRGWLILALIIIVVIAGLVWWFGRPRITGSAQDYSGNSSISAQKLANNEKPNQRVMPNLNGDSIPEAINILEQRGILPGNIILATKSINNGTSHIIATSPLTNQKLANGQKVDLTIGVPNGSALVPNLSGLNVSTAAQQLLALQLHYSYVYKNSSLANKGKVIAQAPKPYTVVAKNSQVKFVVATSY